MSTTNLEELLNTDVTEYNEFYTPVVGGDTDIWGMFLNANIERYDQHIPKYGPLNERPSAASLPNDVFHMYVATDTNPISIYYYDGANWTGVWTGDASTLGGTSANGFLRTSGGTLNGRTVINHNSFRNHLRLIRSGAGTYDLSPTTDAGGGVTLSRESNTGFGPESRLSWIYRDGAWQLERGDTAVAGGDVFYHSGNLSPEDIGAFPTSGGTISGDVSVDGNLNVTGTNVATDSERFGGWEYNEIAYGRRTFRVRMTTAVNDYTHIATFSGGTSVKSTFTIRNATGINDPAEWGWMISIQYRDGNCEPEWYGWGSERQRAWPLVTRETVTDGNDKYHFYIETDSYTDLVGALDGNEQYFPQMMFLGEYDDPDGTGPHTYTESELTGNVVLDGRVDGPNLPIFAGSLDIGGDITTGGVSVATDTDLSAHTSSTSNPHSVTAAQAGALPDTGGTLTGDLEIAHPSGHSRNTSRYLGAPSPTSRYVILLEQLYGGSDNHTHGSFTAFRGSSDNRTAAVVDVLTKGSNSASDHGATLEHTQLQSNSSTLFRFVTCDYNGTTYLALDYNLQIGYQGHNGGVLFSGYSQSTGAENLTLVEYAEHDDSTIHNSEVYNSLTPYTETDSTRKRIVADSISLEGKAQASETPTDSSDIATKEYVDANAGAGLHERVASVQDTNGSTPVNVSLTVPDPTAHASYRLMGIVWGSNYSTGEGGEVDLDITLNNYTTGVYEHTLMNQGTLTFESDQPHWTDKIWRRYKHPLDYTISADSIPLADTADGNDSTFITITNNSQGGYRGLMNGRMGDTWVNGGHPFSTVESIEVACADNMQAELVLYGIDWRSDV